MSSPCSYQFSHTDVRSTTQSRRGRRLAMEAAMDDDAMARAAVLGDRATALGYAWARCWPKEKGVGELRARRRCAGVGSRN